MPKIFAGRCAILLLSMPLTAFADLTITQVQTTQSLKKGQPDGAPTIKTSTIWISPDKLCMLGADESTLLLAAKDSLYQINTSKKTYTGMSFSQLTSSPTQENATPPEVAALMGNMMKMEITIQPTTETKQINTWNCKKYLQTLTMMGTTTTSELWATEDVKIDPTLFKKFNASFFLRSQSTKDLAVQMQKECEKIKGYVVYSVSTSSIMGKESKSTMEVKEIKESAAPAGTYEIPAKFKAKKWE